MTMTTPHEIDLRPAAAADVLHQVHLTSGEVVTVVGADAYQPEGPMTTFFSTGSSRATIDSWSIRLASFRTANVVSIQRETARSLPAGFAPRHTG